MRSRLRKKFARARAASEFHARYPHHDDPGREAVARLAESIAEEEALSERELRAVEEGERLAAEREALAAPLVRGFDLLIGFLQAVAAGEGIGELDVHCIRYRSAAIGAFLREGRAALTLAAAHLPHLIAYGMPPAMVEVLSGQLGEAEAIHRRRLDCAAVVTKAALDLASLAARQIVLLRHLDALNRYRFMVAPERLVEWRAALALPRNGHSAAPPATEAGTRSTP